MKRRASLFAATLLAGLCVTAVAAAQDAIAEALFEEAREAFQAGNYIEACPKFAQSQKREPKLGTLLNLAVCNEKLGKIASAWVQYKSVVALAKREGQKDREDFAREKVAELAGKIPKLRIVSSAPVDATITLDGEPVSRETLSIALPIDPGPHALAVTAPGKKPWSTTVNVPNEPGEIVAEIPMLEDGEGPPPVPMPVAPAPGVAPATPQPPIAQPSNDKGTDLTWLTITGFSVGGAGLLIGAITGGVTLGQASSLRDDCGDVCPNDRQDDVDQANTLATVSTAMFVVGGVGVVAGILGLALTDSPSDGGDSVALGSTIVVEPVVGPGYFGLNGRF